MNFWHAELLPGVAACWSFAAGVLLFVTYVVVDVASWWRSYLSFRRALRAREVALALKYDGDAHWEEL